MSVFKGERDAAPSAFTERAESSCTNPCTCSPSCTYPATCYCTSASKPPACTGKCMSPTSE